MNRIAAVTKIDYAKEILERWQRANFANGETDYPARPWKQTPPPGALERRTEMGKRILIVDDEAQFRRALRAALHSCGYETADVPSGEMALENLGEVAPDLILLDMNMPGMSGLDTCRAVRSFSGVPIVILSVRSAEKDKQEARQAGANDYLTKPFSIRELLSHIQLVLQD
jgi:CheY-like chemotaxis protein